MANERGSGRGPGVAGDKSAEQGTTDPRATDHPTGAKQAAENAANESPS